LHLEAAMLERKISVPRTEKFLQRDRRADEGKRQVQFSGGDIMISRRFAGIPMMISVPVSAYRGVVLDVEPCAQGGASYKLSLAHADPDLDIILSETRDSGAVAADWRYWAASLELPRLWSRDSDAANDAPATAGFKIEGAFSRKRHPSVTQRRPYFCARRKQGDIARMAEVHADEREIICYE
jgi:hypothetical protein